MEFDMSLANLKKCVSDTPASIAIIIISEEDLLKNAEFGVLHDLIDEGKIRVESNTPNCSDIETGNSLTLIFSSCYNFLTDLQNRAKNVKKVPFNVLLWTLQNPNTTLKWYFLYRYPLNLFEKNGFIVRYERSDEESNLQYINTFLTHGARIVSKINEANIIYAPNRCGNYYSPLKNTQDAQLAKQLLEIHVAGKVPVADDVWYKKMRMNRGLDQIETVVDRSVPGRGLPFYLPEDLSGRPEIVIKIKEMNGTVIGKFSPNAICITNNDDVEPGQVYLYTKTQRTAMQEIDSVLLQTSELLSIYRNEVVTLHLEHSVWRHFPVNSAPFCSLAKEDVRNHGFFFEFSENDSDVFKFNMSEKIENLHAYWCEKQEDADHVIRIGSCNEDVKPWEKTRYCFEQWIENGSHVSCPDHHMPVKVNTAFCSYFQGKTFMSILGNNNDNEIFIASSILCQLGAKEEKMPDAVDNLSFLLLDEKNECSVKKLEELMSKHRGPLQNTTAYNCDVIRKLMQVKEHEMDKVLTASLYNSKRKLKSDAPSCRQSADKRVKTAMLCDSPVNLESEMGHSNLPNCAAKIEDGIQEQIIHFLAELLANQSSSKEVQNEEEFTNYMTDPFNKLQQQAGVYHLPNNWSISDGPLADIFYRGSSTDDISQYTVRFVSSLCRFLYSVANITATVLKSSKTVGVFARGRYTENIVVAGAKISDSDTTIGVHLEITKGLFDCIRYQTETPSRLFSVPLTVVCAEKIKNFSTTDCACSRLFKSYPFPQLVSSRSELTSKNCCLILECGSLYEEKECKMVMCYALLIPKIAYIKKEDMLAETIDQFLLKRDEAIVTNTCGLEYLCEKCVMPEVISEVFIDFPIEKVLDKKDFGEALVICTGCGSENGTFYLFKNAAP